MYLKNGLIKFLKVKNVILLILGVFLVSSSVAIITQLIVGYFGDWFTILHARAFPESVFLIIIGIVLIVCSRISRRLIKSAVIPLYELTLLLMVGIERLELSRVFKTQGILNPLCLPISPYSHT